MLQFCINSEKSTPVKLQSLQFCINSKTINLHHVKSVIIFAKMVDVAQNPTDEQHLDEEPFGVEKQEKSLKEE